MSYHKIYEDLTLAAHRAYTRGLQTGSGGNMAARIPETQSMVVKNSGGLPWNSSSAYTCIF